MAILYHTPGQTSDPASGVAATKAFSVNYLNALYGQYGLWRRVNNFSADVKNFGESVTVPVMPALSAVDVTLATGAYVPGATTIGSSTITINKYKMIGQQIPMNVLDQSKVDYVPAFSKSAADAMSKTMDRDVMGLVAGFSQTAGTLGSDLTEAIMHTAIETLLGKGLSLSDTRDYVWVLPYTQYSTIAGFKSYSKFTVNAGSTLADGTSDVRLNVDSAFGVDIYWASAADATASLTVSGGLYGALMHKDAVGIAIQAEPKMYGPILVPATDNVEYRLRALYGVGELSDDRAVRLLTV